MKKIIIITIMLTAVLAAMAQQGLAVDKVFKGSIVPLEQMVETRVRGKDIAKYQLSYFRSLRFGATPAQTEEIFSLVEKDEHQESVRSGSDSPGVCVKARKISSKHNEVILIYMEGTLNSLEKLGEILKN